MLWAFTRVVVPRVLLVVGVGSCVSGAILFSDVLLFVSLISFMAFMLADTVVNWEVL